METGSANDSSKLVFCDLHIHSKYSRATSGNMDLESIAHFAQLKGLNLVGTGDFTHPGWLKDLKNSLSKIEDTNLYRLKPASSLQICFMITGEVCTIFHTDKKARKIHHLILTPDFDTAEQINDRLSTRGNLGSDGRPTLDMSASELVEEAMEVSNENAVIPAHIWTPWYSLFGSINGFDRIEDCYEEMTKHIFALETGLSSDPPMNWRLSALDRFALVSNSDSHSPYPYRLGREANVFALERMSYREILEAIREKDSERFRFTVETKPAYGKYHWTGHRNCGVSVPPSESRRLGGVCPVCRRPLTRGVDERVDNLADRSAGFRPGGTIDYVHLLPLHEAIGAALNVDSLSSPTVWKQFNSLVAAFGNEYAVMLDASLESLEKVVEPRIAETIVKIRKDDVTVIPGYDGVYGEIKLSEKKETQNAGKYGLQSSLERFVK